jgi:hypothetical protein
MFASPYPMLDKVIRDATHSTPESVFGTGLKVVLDGLAAPLPR